MGRYISFSLWGNNKVYTYGMIENAILAQTMYPGWTVRVHHNDTVPNAILTCLGSLENVELIHHPGLETKAVNMFWRFEDIFIEDATVLVRDADSRFTEREVRFVNEWLQSNKDFHIVRDHKHHTVPIMGCSVGVRNNCIRHLPVQNGNRNINGAHHVFMDGLALTKQFVHDNNQAGYCIDQMFLWICIYPYVMFMSMIHAQPSVAFEPFCTLIDELETGFVGEVVTRTPVASKLLGDSECDFQRVASYTSETSATAG